MGTDIWKQRHNWNIYSNTDIGEICFDILCRILRSVSVATVTKRGLGMDEDRERVPKCPLRHTEPYGRGKAGTRNNESYEIFSLLLGLSFLGSACGEYDAAVGTSYYMVVCICPWIQS
jgi:hypothetical protein